MIDSVGGRTRTRTLDPLIKSSVASEIRTLKKINIGKRLVPQNHARANLPRPSFFAARAISFPISFPLTDYAARKSWSEWQDLNLRPPRPERGISSTRILSIFAPQRDDFPSVSQFIEIISPPLHHPYALRPKFGCVHVSAPNVIRFLVC
jgi:hypothetical protein